jgi:hypothetical protein
VRDGKNKYRQRRRTSERDKDGDKTEGRNKDE